MKMISANTYGYNAWKCHDEGKTKKKDQNPYCHSICHSVIAHLWENLPFPIDTISNMKASSWNHLKCLSVLVTDFTFYTTMQYAVCIQISYLPIQVEQVKAFRIQNGIWELSKSTRRN